MQCQVDRGAHIARPADGQVRAGHQQLHRLAGFGLAAAGFDDVIRGAQQARLLRRGGKLAVRRQAFEDFEIFEGVQRFIVHKVPLYR